jgi:hypothetical protein
VPVRSAIAQLPGTSDIDISVEEKFVRFKFESEKTDLQLILSAIAGKARRFEGRLVLQIDPKTPSTDFDRLSVALKAVKGVRGVTRPDEKGIVLVTLEPEDKTFLPAIQKAAAESGVPVKDPSKKSATEPPTHSDNSVSVLRTAILLIH